MSKVEWKAIYKKYRIVIQHQVSIAQTLVALEMFYGFTQEQVDILARLVL